MPELEKDDDSEIPLEEQVPSLASISTTSSDLTVGDLEDIKDDYQKSSKMSVLALHGRPLKTPYTYSYDDWDWDELPEIALEQARVLGYDQDKWDNDKPVPIETLKWHQLSPAQQKAVIFFEWEPDEADVSWGIEDENDPEYYMQRERRNSGYFVPRRGLVGENQLFWNTMEDIEGRDVLLQSKENYETLLQVNEFSSFLTKCWQKDDLMPCPSYYQNATFGEQLLVEGLDCTNICIGDVFEVAEDANGLMLQVSSPRYPCYNVDKKHKSPFGSKGIRRYTMVNGLGGWFCRVLREGSLECGDRLVRTHHPHPTWDLKFLSKVMYGEGKTVLALTAKVDWKRDVSLLEELVAIKELAEYEWKAQAREALENIQAATKHKEPKLDQLDSCEFLGLFGLPSASLQPGSFILACLMVQVALGWLIANRSQLWIEEVDENSATTGF